MSGCRAEPCSSLDLLIEPQAFLHGEAAAQAIADGIALPFQGGPSGFSLARLIGPDGATLPVSQAPAAWRHAMDRITEAAPSAGLPADTLVMGILNVTPDSFSDGGRHLRIPDALAAGLAMIAAGASILDIGGESTRPGAQPVAAAEEQSRILPVLAGLHGHGALLSVDTRNAATMRAALESGADLINDVSALSHDPDAAGVLAEHACPVVLMHSRGTPAAMSRLARYDDVAAEVVRELASRIAHAIAAGIDRSRIIVDPGIGFAKDERNNLEMLRRLPILANLGCRLLLGVSRKRFIGDVTGIADAAGRDPGSLVAGLTGLVFPGCILRVHDVPGAVQGLQVWRAIQG